MSDCCNTKIIRVNDNPSQDSEIFTVEQCVDGLLVIQAYQILFSNGIAGDPVAIGTPLETGYPCKPDQISTKNVCFTSTASGIFSDGSYTVAPDTSNDLLGISLVIEDSEGEQIIFDCPADKTWAQWFEGGELEEKIKNNLYYPYSFSWTSSGLGEDKEYNTQLTASLPEQYQNISFNFTSGDSTVSSGVRDFDYSSEGVYTYDVCTGSGILLIDCIGNVVEGYTITPCLDKNKDVFDYCFCGTAILNTGRGGIYDPRNGPFYISSITGNTWEEFVYNASISGVNIELLTSGLADGATVKVCSDKVLGDIRYDSELFEGGVIVELTWVEEKSQRVSLSECDKNFFQELLKDCDSCPPITTTDTVCNADDITLNGVLIPAGQPIIRKIITTYTSVGCDCVEENIQTRFFDFQNPVFEFTEEFTFDGVCNSETDTVIRCDRNGNEIQVVTITVFTDDGGIVVQSYADQDGNPIPEPLLPLSICNPDVEPISACVEIDGENVYGILHVQYDKAGNAGFEISQFTSNDGNINQQLGSLPFKLNCTATDVECEEEQITYCYDVSSFEFTCTASTIEIDGVVVDLCGEGNSSGQFVTSGNICDTGGIRSENDPVRHPNAANLNGVGYDISSVVSDDLNISNQISNEGCIGGLTQSGNTTAKVLLGADVFGLSGTAPTITLSGDWSTGSGIGVGVYDCASNTILPFASSETQTPSIYDNGNFGVEIFNSPTGVWSYNGPASWLVDTSSVADLSTLVVYTVVINPTGDELCNLAVNGQIATPSSCDVTDVEILIKTLTNITGTTWILEDGIICTTSSSELGPLTCGETSVNPEKKSKFIKVKSQRVQLDACSIKSISDNSCNLLPIKRDFCGQSKGSVATVKPVNSVKFLSEIKTQTKVKESQTKPGKILSGCEVRWYDCGEYQYSTWYWQGKEFDQNTWDKLSISEVVCGTPDSTYSPAAVTCATEIIDDLTVVLNCQVFTNDNDPTDLFTQYTLADSYEGIGDIGDLYTPESEPDVIPCPDGSIIEVIECYEALQGIKGVANEGDTIEVVSITNSIASTTYYTITHSSTGSIIYEGIDPVGEVNIDISDTNLWNGPTDCQPEDNLDGDIIIREVCLDVGDDVILNAYAVLCVSKTSTTLVRYEDTVGNVVYGVPVNCTCDAIDIAPEPLNIASDICLTEQDAIDKAVPIALSRTPCNTGRGALFQWTNDGYYPINSWFLTQFSNRGAAETWDIDWGDGVVVSGSTVNQTHQYTTSGTYNITVTLNSAGNQCNGETWTETVIII